MAQLAFGVTSRTAVDAALGLAPRYPGRVLLIASRAQVEPVTAPGGYVEGWTSGDLVGYVRRRDPYGALAVCRDHGGPWQHPAECAAGLSEEEAVRSSLRSLRADIDAGMRVLHLDTSRELDRPATAASAVRRLLTLYGECHEYASATGRTVDFEIGVEEQSPAAGDAGEFRRTVADLVARLDAAGLPRPLFIVAQTGTKVVEDGNRGALLHDPKTVRRAVPRLRATCRAAGARLKAHNGDYLDQDALRTLTEAGVDAVNVAPELGVAETRAFLGLLWRLGLTRAADAFLALAHDSGAWRKWLAPGSAAGDLQRSVLAGHYVFGTADFRELKAEAGRALGGDVDAVLRAAVEEVMLRYLRVAARPGAEGREVVGRLR